MGKAEKRCPKCGKVLPISMFARDKRHSDGYASRCKQCVNAYKKAYYEANKEKVKAKAMQYYRENSEQKQAYQTMWRLRNPQYMRDYHASHPVDSEVRRQKYLENKEHLDAAAKAYREKNADTLREKRRLKYAADPLRRANAAKNRHERKARMENLPYSLTTQDWLDAVAFFGGKCAYCGANGALEQDHVIPVTCGGAYVRENIVPACKSCNSSKGNKQMEIWFRQRSYFTEEKLSKIQIWMTNYKE